MTIRNFEPKDAKAVSFSFVIRQTMSLSNSRDYQIARLEPLIEYFSPEKVILLNQERHCLVAEIENQIDRLRGIKLNIELVACFFESQLKSGNLDDFMVMEKEFVETRFETTK
jgi:hypothetical protein